MRKFSIYFLLLPLALLEVSLLPLPLTLLWLLCWARVYDESEAIGAACIGGVLLDLLGFTIIGTHTLLFLALLSGLFIVFRMGNIGRKGLVTCIYALFAIVIYNIIKTTVIHGTLAFTLSFWQVVISMAVFCSFLLFFLIVIRPKEQEHLKLRLQS